MGLKEFCNCSKYCGFQIAGSLEHGYLFFGDERAYTVMQAKDADKGGRSSIEEVHNSLNLAISPLDGRPPGSSGKSQLKAFAWFVRKKKISMLLHKILSIYGIFVN